jgi:hypothetical protein
MLIILEDVLRVTKNSENIQSVASSVKQTKRRYIPVFMVPPVSSHSLIGTAKATAPQSGSS